MPGQFSVDVTALGAGMGYMIIVCVKSLMQYQTLNCRLVITVLPLYTDIHGGSQ